MNIEDNSDIESSSDDLVMLPPIEKANAETDTDSDASDDMNDGFVHHLPRSLLNSTCDSICLTKKMNRKICATHSTPK